MSETSQRHPITLKRFVHRLPGMETVPVRHGIEYRVCEAGRLTMDIYYPLASANNADVPLVVLVTEELTGLLNDFRLGGMTLTV